MALQDFLPDEPPYGPHTQTGSGRTGASALAWRLLPGVVISIALAFAGVRWIASNWDAGTATSRLAMLRALFAGGEADDVSEHAPAVTTARVHGDTTGSPQPGATSATSLVAEREAVPAVPSRAEHGDNAATPPPVYADGKPVAVLDQASPAPARRRSPLQRPSPPVAARGPSAAGASTPARPRTRNAAAEQAASAARRAAIAAELERKLGPPVRPISGVRAEPDARSVPEDE